MSDRLRSERSSSQSRVARRFDGVSHSLCRRLTSPSWLSRVAGVGLSAASIGFVLLFAVTLDSGGELTLITQPLPMRIALALPSLVAIFTMGTTVGAILAWLYRYWSLFTRIHQTVLAVLGIGFTWQLAVLGFLPL